MIWFNYNEHSHIDEDMKITKKKQVFIDTLRCCEERVIEVFHEICRENDIFCVPQGNKCTLA